MVYRAPKGIKECEYNPHSYSHPANRNMKETQEYEHDPHSYSHSYYSYAASIVFPLASIVFPFRLKLYYSIIIVS
jgi:hypothetical protein